MSSIGFSEMGWKPNKDTLIQGRAKRLPRMWSEKTVKRF